MEVKSNIKNVTKETDKLGKSIGKASDETKDLDKGLEETGKSGSKGFKAIGTAVKGFGMALKAAGIGLLIGLFVALKEAMERNQKVMNVVNTVMTTISTTFNQVVDVLVDTYNWVTKSSDRFDGLGKVLKGIMTLALNPLKISFYAIKLAVQQLMLAWEKSPLGKGDEGKIAALTGEIGKTQTTIQGLAADMVDAGKSIVNNFGDALSEIGAIATKVVDGVKDISIKANYEMAQATVAAQNNAKLAEAQLQGLIEKNDLLAETQRQIRDDETKTFAERIAANEELGRVLDKQEVDMLKLADARVAAAALELSANKDNVDLQVAYQQALNDRAGVEAQVAGFRSEQMTNEVALSKELLEAQRELLLAGLEGLELELADLKSAYELKLEMARKAGEDDIAITEQYLKEKQDIIDAADKVAKDLAIANEKAVADAKAKIRDANISNIESGIGLIKSLAGENKEIMKVALIAENAVGIAKNIINTNAANARLVLEGGVVAAAPLIAANMTRMGIGIAASVAATATGLAALGGGGDASGGGSGGSASGAPATPAPQMMSGAFDLTGGQAPEAMRAYVVTDEMTNSQNQLANIRRRATI